MDCGLKDRLQKIYALISQIRAASDRPTRDAALELLDIIMEFHAAGIDRMMEMTAAGGDEGWEIINSFSRDELVSHLLLLHGLHPSAMETRVRDALEKVRPMLHSHGGDVELVEIAGSVVRLRLVGSCKGCPSSTLTLRT